MHALERNAPQDNPVSWWREEAQCMASRASFYLTSGQMNCLRLVSQNLTSKEIAARLGVSPHTVDQRLRRALRALNASNRREAARIAEIGCQFDDETIEISTAEEPSQPGSIPARARAFHWPFATEANPSNSMGVALRLFWILAIAIGAMASILMYLAGLESLSRLLHR
jgi:DNA-binding CsgD family transcriptional regulator